MEAAAGKTVGITTEKAAIEMATEERKAAMEMATEAKKVAIELAIEPWKAILGEGFSIL